MKDLPQILVLDCSKWRCGSTSRQKENTLGKGDTLLENKEGYQCCLGQWINQTDPDIEILYIGSPRAVNSIKCLVIRNNNSDFTTACMDINDNSYTTVREKVTLLRNELKQIGRKLKVLGLRASLVDKEEI